MHSGESGVKRYRGIPTLQLGRHGSLRTSYSVLPVSKVLFIVNLPFLGEPELQDNLLLRDPEPL